MNFEPELYAKLSSKPYEAALEVCAKVDNNVSNTEAGRKNNASLLFEAGKILNSLITNNLIQSNLSLPPVKDGKPENLASFYSYIEDLHRNLKSRSALIEALEVEAELDRLLLNSVDSKSGFELMSGDLDKIPKVLDELEQVIADSAELSEDHKIRISKRIEELRKEIGKKITTLDSLYCLGIDLIFTGQKYGPSAVIIAKLGNYLFSTAVRINAQAEGLATGDIPHLTNEQISNNLID
ncbi:MULTISPECIES: hypothetical protein [Pseudomonas syringae group]|uniref:Uncharacterized protein n=1 Tax=Pseudomonas syringae pv. coriandricola TaxID=264453 RepID=A0A3M3JLR5_9PSED|nr:MULTISPECIES: hypothetical protein [Pseudomonas syringae group]RMN11744.1 hypothetical protein ALQ65_200202 [Pseudomonas syringae pv. coriandricola]